MLELQSLQQIFHCRFSTSRVKSNLSLLIAVGIMPEHYRKWKLNKSEQKKVDDEEQALVVQLIRAGKTKNEAQQQAAQAKEVQVKALGMELNLIDHRLMF